MVSLPWWSYLAIATLSVSVYANASVGEFTFDDNSAVLENKVLRPETPWTDIWYSDFWGTPMQSKKSHKSYRPLTTATYRLNYQWGGLDPTWYRTVNIGLHALVSVLVLVLANTVLNTSDDSSTTSTSGVVIPVLTAAVFAVHPIHTEAVCGVVGRAEILCAACYLLACLCYHQACQSTSLLSLFFATLFLVAATLSKETGTTIVVVCVVIEFVHCYRLSVQRQALPLGAHTSLSMALHALLRVVVIVLATAAYMMHRFSLTSKQGPVFAHIDNPIAFIADDWSRRISYSWVYCRYLWLLIYPKDLCCDYSYNCIEEISDLSGADLRILPALALPLFTVVVALYTIYQFLSHNDARPGLAFAWTLAPFLPCMHIFVTVATVIGERLLYLPSIGYCLFIGWACQRLLSPAHRLLPPSTSNTTHTTNSTSSSSATTSDDEGNKNKVNTSGNRMRHGPVSYTFFLLSSLLIVPLAARTYTRNQDWIDNKHLFASGLQVCANSAKLQLCNGVVLAQETQVVQARDYFRRALEISPDYAEAWYTLGKSYKETGDLQKAAELLKHGLSLEKNHFGLNQDYGIVLAQQNQAQAGLLHLQRAARIRPHSGSIHNDLATALSLLGHNTKALHHYTLALKYQPDQHHVHSNMAFVLATLKRCQEAVQSLQVAAKFTPHAIANVAKQVKAMCPEHLRLKQEG